MSGLSKFQAVLAAEVSSRPLALVRIAVGLAIWEQFTSPWVGHRVDDVAGVLVLAWIVLLTAWLVIFGLATRWAAGVMALAFAGLHLYYGVHLGDAALAAPVPQFQLIVLLAITPCGRSLSLDRALAVRRARRRGEPPPPERASAWQLDLFALQAASMFLWLGIADTDPDWLGGAWLERDVVRWYGSDMLAAHPDLPALLRAAAKFALVVELGVAALLLPRRLRPYGMWLGLGFVYLDMLLLAHSFATFYAHLILMVPLIGCASPDRVHALVRDQSAHAAAGTEVADAPVRWTHPVLGAVLGAVMLLAALAWFNVPRYRGEVLEQPRGFGSSTWTLRQSTPGQACDIRYYDMSGDHNRDGVLIERWQLLGHERPGAVPAKLAQVSRHTLDDSTIRVCKALRKAGDDDPQVELDARCTAGNKWVTVHARERRLCAPAKTRRK